MARDTVIWSDSWCRGYDAEYEFTVDVYDGWIHWRLEFDEQWVDPPRSAMQTFEEFLRDGPPDIWGTPGFRNEMAEDKIRRMAAESLRPTGPS